MKWKDERVTLLARVFALGSGFMLGIVLAFLVTWIFDNAIPLFWAWVVFGAIGLVLGALFPRVVSAILPG